MFVFYNESILFGGVFESLSLTNKIQIFLNKIFLFNNTFRGGTSGWLSELTHEAGLIDSIFIIPACQLTLVQTAALPGGQPCFSCAGLFYISFCPAHVREITVF